MRLHSSVYRLSFILHALTVDDLKIFRICVKAPFDIESEAHTALFVKSNGGKLTPEQLW